MHRSRASSVLQRHVLPRPLRVVFKNCGEVAESMTRQCGFVLHTLRHHNARAHSFTHSLTLTHARTHSLTHALTPACTHLLTHALTHSHANAHVEWRGLGYWFAVVSVYPAQFGGFFSNATGSSGALVRNCNNTAVPAQCTYYNDLWKWVPQPANSTLAQVR